MIAEYVIASVQEALERSNGANVVYIHPTDQSPASACIVRAGTPEWEKLHDGEEMVNHDHIEPGMF